MKGSLSALVIGAAVAALAAGAPVSRLGPQDAEPRAGAEGVLVDAGAATTAERGSGDAVVRHLATAGASNATSWSTFTAHAVPKIARRLGIVADDGDACGLAVQQQFNCTDVACEDLVPGYINYIYFYECSASDGGSRFGTFVLFMLWMLYLLHLVEGTTNDYFCTSLQVAVAILQLSPNVAGVTFLAVGNAACDVIASVAAFATGVPKVGVGTTVGAGIFVTCAVVASVTFVADVRLARRSFVRDVLFFIVTVVYLLGTTVDGIITLPESIGFIVIYIVFVVAVAGGRWLRFLRHAGEETEEEDRAGMSFAGASPDEAGLGPSKGTIGEREPTSTVAQPGGGYQAPADGGDAAGAGSSSLLASPQGLSAIDKARRAALATSAQKDAASARARGLLADDDDDDDDDDEDADLFAAQGSAAGGGDEEDDDGDLGSGTGFTDVAGFSPYAGRSGSGSGAGGGRSSSFIEDLAPAKPSKWTRTFLATQNDKGPAYAPFQMPKYHKKRLLKKLLKRLTAHGNTVLTLGDGATLDLAELAVSDPDLAMNIAASMAASVTAAASKSGTRLSYAAAAAAIKSAAAAQGHGHEGGAPAPGGGGHGGASVPVRDVLAVLPHETLKPTANLYNRVTRAIAPARHYWHLLMTVCELPVTLARHLTIPLLHEGSYRRRLVLLNVPFSLAFGCEIVVTHILKGSATDVGGFPLWLLCWVIGVPLAGGMNMLLPSNVPGGTFLEKLTNTRGPSGAGGSGGSGNESAGLLSSAAQQAAGAAGGSGGSASLLSGDGGTGQGSEALVASSSGAAADHHGADAAHHAHHKKKWWIKQFGARLAGPNSEPPPTGWVFTFLLVTSFIMSLFWLLVVANEIVGTAICFGKVLNVPDVVMGLTVLAIGNSINDLAATITIAKEGYPTMAVAGAYAGPMFNVLAGIGLPMVIYTMKDPSQQYAIGKDTPLVWASFITLLVSLTVTLVWVPFEGWRLTRRIGKFLLAWFGMFIVMVLVVGLTGLSPEDTAAHGLE